MLLVIVRRLRVMTANALRLRDVNAFKQTTLSEDDLTEDPLLVLKCHEGVLTYVLHVSHFRFRYTCKSINASVCPVACVAVVRCCSCPPLLEIVLRVLEAYLQASKIFLITHAQVGSQNKSSTRS